MRPDDARMVGFPKNHQVFLLKMIKTWGVKWGYSTILRKHTSVLPWMFHDNYGSPFVESPFVFFEWCFFPRKDGIVIF